MAKRATKPAAASKVFTVPRLSQGLIDQQLVRLPEWTQAGDALQRTYSFADFVAAMRFVDKAAAVAEAAQHHPDILIRYNKVTMTLSTHDAGGISQKDIDMAGALDQLAAG